MSERETYTRLTATADIANEARVLHSERIISNTARHDAAIDLLEFSKTQCTDQLQEFARANNVTIERIRFHVDENYEPPIIEGIRIP